MPFLKEYCKQCLSFWIYIAICCLYVCLLFSAQSWKCFTPKKRKRSKLVSSKFGKIIIIFLAKQSVYNEWLWFDLICVYKSNMNGLRSPKHDKWMNVLCMFHAKLHNLIQMDIKQMFVCTSSVNSALPIEHCTVCIQNTKIVDITRIMNEWRSKP